MMVIKRDTAIDTLTKRVSQLSDDDLVEVHNELFPNTPISIEDVAHHKASIVDKVADHVHRGLENQEIVDLWNVIFPSHRNVWYEEAENLLHCEEQSDDASEPSQLTED